MDNPVYVLFVNTILTNTISQHRFRKPGILSLNED